MGSVARVSEISASSSTSFDDALTAGVTRAQETLRNVKSAWVKEMQVEVGESGITEYRVNMLVTFVLE